VILIFIILAAILGIVLVSTVVQPQECSSGWHCYDSTHRGYENSDCSWSSVTVCPNGCLDGECIMPLPGDDIMDWKVQSIQNNSVVFEVYQSINPAHGCAQYQTGCDYKDYTWLGGTLLKDGSYIYTDWFPGQEFQPEQLQPYIVGWNQVQIKVYGDEPITSDEVEFRLLESINKGTDTVYTERFPFVHTWNP
jgi:hypothetical protein